MEYYKTKILSSVDYQKILEDQILRLNYRAFKQIVVLGLYHLINHLY